MKKLLVLTTILSFLLGSNAFAASQMTGNEEKMINAIQKAAMNDEWTQYTPAMQNASQTLYFKKKIKNKDYFTYRYQNRHPNKQMTVYVKVAYTNNKVDVEFVDKIQMNAGRLGTDSKVHNVLNELTDAIENQLATDA